MPMPFESESQHNEADTANKCCRVSDDQPSFGVESTRVALCIVSPNCVMEEMTDKPTEQDTNNTKEVEVTCVRS